MRKVLVTAHLGRHFRIFGHYDYKVLLEMGYEVHIAANFHDEIDHFDDARVIKHQIDFERNPFSKQNLKAYKQIQKVMDEENFDFVHTQSPSGGAVTRLAARKARNKGTRVIYTAHGFHFFKGAPKKNWALYYPIEKLLSNLTDTIITINEEDYNQALRRLNAKNIELVHGVGIDLNKFVPQSPELKSSLRKKYGFKEEDFILVYAGELSYRKQQDLIIKAISKVKNKIPNIKLLLAGNGNCEDQYKTLATRMKVENNIEFLGYRNDVSNLMLIADVAVSASRQEGLPVNIMEAMATGLPLIVTDCRGNRDLVKENENGIIVTNNDEIQFSCAIERIYLDNTLRQLFKDNNIELINQYSLIKISRDMKILYSNL
ncbi:glycosyltransferase family 4 protein [Planococcus sp. N064]|uniref:Glycosyltransferase family 4 protein n=1 Tax=Planococcus liqunii TaxID=3058394 RepID=A0ABT8MNJ0_9BACL|nr:glycosyltransferase family 4 protein [Planococcus sp. N064]MDN7226434.1 glycosyltransferase family 4 protein [Planococcus sp. N064]